MLEGANAPQSRSSCGVRARIVGVALFVCASLAIVQSLQPRPRLIWNASASVPVGLYWMDDNRDLKRGDLVLVWLPQAARKRAAERSYLPWNTPAAKRVAALEGDIVCMVKGIVRINDRTVAKVLAADRLGRRLEAWRGCVVLGSGHVFLLTVGAETSFDGRYFGPSLRSDIIGRLVPLWTF